jgi:hypothetical protein
MARLAEWAELWSEDEAQTADLFERDLFGPPRRQRTHRRGAVLHAESAVPASPPPSVSPPSVVLQRTRLRLPTLGQEFDVSKVLDTSTGAATTRATDSAGNLVNSRQKIAEEARAHLRRYRQIHPTLAELLTRARPMDRFNIVAWIYVPEDLYDKGATQREGPLIASRESVMEPRSPGAPDRGAEPPDRRAIAYRQQVDAAVERASRELPAATGVRFVERIGMVPSVVVQATAEQIRALSVRPEVAGLFLHEPEGIDDLADSMQIARATTVVTAGWRGTNIRVSLWEGGPDVLTDLRIEESFDPARTLQTSHARLTTAVIKNRQASGPHGYAPDAKIFSANSRDLKALNWAIVSKNCRVINQSFHRPSEQTTATMSFDDLAKDYYATRYPYPTIVQAAGNQPSANTEFVNHKGFNGIVVGNHDDAARLMRPTSVFRNPTSSHQDRELPDICANGDNVTAVGLTMGGTSFASPAVAGSVALVQHAANSLLNWPEGCRAIVLAAAGRNVLGSTWWDDVNHRVDGKDGAGALDTRESVLIARARSSRNGAATRRGFDTGTVYPTDFEANGRSRFKYMVSVPAGDTPKHVRVALAWSSKVAYLDDPTATPPIRAVTSTLTVDLDLHVYQGNRLVAWSSSFDNSYEVVDFQGTPGTTYDIVIRRWSGTDWVWYGIAWAVF